MTWKKTGVADINAVCYNCPEENHVQPQLQISVFGKYTSLTNSKIAYQQNTHFL